MIYPQHRPGYHKVYRNRFNLKSDQQIPFNEADQSSTVEENKTKRSTKGPETDENFSKSCNWLEAEAKLYSVSELFDQMKLLSDHEDEIYCRPFYLKAQLVKRYGDDIFFAEINGKRDVDCTPACSLTSHSNFSLFCVAFPHDPACSQALPLGSRCISVSPVPSSPGFTQLCLFQYDLTGF